MDSMSLRVFISEITNELRRKCSVIHMVEMVLEIMENKVTKCHWFYITAASRRVDKLISTLSDDLAT